MCVFLAEHWDDCFPSARNSICFKVKSDWVKHLNAIHFVASFATLFLISVVSIKSCRFRFCLFFCFPFGNGCCFGVHKTFSYYLILPFILMLSALVVFNNDNGNECQVFCFKSALAGWLLFVCMQASLEQMINNDRCKEYAQLYVCNYVAFIICSCKNSNILPMTKISMATSYVTFA